LEFGKGLFDDFEDLVNLMFICTPADKQPEIIESTFECEKTFLPDDINCFSNIENGPNSSGRLKGVFVSPNVFNLSKRQLSTSEISLLSKGLKFVPTPNFVNRAILKEELEIFGRKLRLKWHFRNQEGPGTFNPFRPKSKFNPKGKDAAIEMYLSRLEEEMLAIDTKLSYSNLTREERNAIKSLKDDPSIVIKEADKGSAVVVWDS